MSRESARPRTVHWSNALSAARCTCERHHAARAVETLLGRAPWPQFRGVDIAGMARAFGCPATRVETHPQLIETLDEELIGLSERAEPLLIEVVVSR